MESIEPNVKLEKKNPAKHFCLFFARQTVATGQNGLPFSQIQSAATAVTKWSKMLNAAPAKHDIFQTFRCQFIAQLHVEMLISKIIESEVEKMGHISAREFHFLTFSDIF